MKKNIDLNMIRPYTKQEEEILRQGLMSSEIVEDIGDRMEQEIMEVTNG
jgi:hypothetical protein